jgi:hypothetical protein
MAIRHTESRPPNGLHQRLGRAHDTIVKQAAAVATDKAIRGAGIFTRQTIRTVGLGRLSNAVADTSSLRQGRRPSSNSYGVLYARGGDESLAGGALDAYSRGATIRPRNGAWLWFQTKALARTARVGTGGRRRLTPELYNAIGAPLGPLHFRRIRPDLAVLYAEKVTVSARTGRARRAGPRAKSVEKRVTVFFGIKNTKRTKRFDVGQIVSRFAGLVPVYMVEEIRKAIAAGQADIINSAVRPDNRR